VLRRDVMWIVSQLCCNKISTLHFSAIEAVIPVVIEMIQFSDREVNGRALWTLSCFTEVSRRMLPYERSGDRIAVVMRYGALPAVMRHLPSTDCTIELSALRILGSIVYAGHARMMVIEQGGIAALLTVLQGHEHDPSPTVNDEILSTLSNIVSTIDQQPCIMHVNALLQAGVFTHIAHHIVSEHETIRYRSQHTISNALVNASNSDRTAIIGTSSFRALLTASTTNRITPYGAVALQTALKEDLDAVLAVASHDELQLVVVALKGNQHHEVNRRGRWIDELLRDTAHSAFGKAPVAGPDGVEIAMGAKPADA
jgi:hypothetical protein